MVWLIDGNAESVDAADSQWFLSPYSAVMPASFTTSPHFLSSERI